MVPACVSLASLGTTPPVLSSPLSSADPAIRLIERMDAGSLDDDGSGKKVGLARLAKNHKLSTSLNSLQYVDGKQSSEKEESSRFRGAEKPPDTSPEQQQISPMKALSKQSATVNLLPNKMNVSELSGQIGDKNRKLEDDSLSLDSAGHIHIPCSDPELIRNSKTGVRSSQSLPLSTPKDIEGENERRKDDEISSKMKGSSPTFDTHKKPSKLLSRRSRLAPPQVKRSSSMTRLSEAINQVHNLCIFPAQPLTMAQSIEVESENNAKTLPQHLSSVRLPEFEVNGSDPLFLLTATNSVADKRCTHSLKLARSTAFRESVKEKRKVSSDFPNNAASLTARVPDPNPDPETPMPLQSVFSPVCDPCNQSSTNVIENGFCTACPPSTKPQTPSTSNKASSTNSGSSRAVTSSSESTKRHHTKIERRTRSQNEGESPGGFLECSSMGAELKHASSAPDSLLLAEDDDSICYRAPYLLSQLEQEQQHLGRSPSWYGYKKSSNASRDAEDQEALPSSPLPGCRSASLDELNTLGLSSKGLPIISPLDAKKKNYLFGGLNSLLGASELDRYFPARTISLFIATWNMNGKEPPVNLEAFLLPDELEQMPDLFVVGTQESGGSRSEWEVRLQATIGPSHVLFTSAIFGVLHLTIFMRRDLLWFCSVPEEATYSLRPGIAYKTKGGVGLGFQFFGTRLLFINSHLTAHEEKQALRIQNFRNISRSLDIPRLLPRRHKRKDVTHQYDCVFWLGDLNFRLAVNRDHVFEKLKHASPDTYQHLLQWDQLTQARQKGEAFSEFEEGTITFAPTFKYDPGTDHYDTSSKQRVPSYTDRILFKSNRGAITCVNYGSCSLFRTSDHKPVLGTFTCKIRPGKDDVPLAAGLFNRDVYLEALRRRRRFLYQPTLRSCPVQ